MLIVYQGQAEKCSKHTLRFLSWAKKILTPCLIKYYLSSFNIDKRNDHTISKPNIALCKQTKKPLFWQKFLFSQLHLGKKFTGKLYFVKFLQY
jgi:hypothetical protein